MVSASSTRSLRSNRRAMHALCTFILRFPIASAPKHTTPSFVTPSSITSTPSMPTGRTAFTSAMTLSPARLEGVDVMDDGVTKEGVVCFGALAIGNLKMKVHKACIARLFERNDLVLDAE